MIRPAPNPSAAVKDWLPFQHIDYAGDLLDPKLFLVGDEEVSPLRIALARGHIALAQAKMTGAMRA